MVDERQPFSRRRSFQPNVLKIDRKHVPTGASIAHEKKVIRQVDVQRTVEHPPEGRRSQIEDILYATTIQHVDRAREVITNALKEDTNLVQRKPATDSTDAADRDAQQPQVVQRSNKAALPIESVKDADAPEGKDKAVEGRNVQSMCVMCTNSFFASVADFVRMLLAELAKSCRSLYAWLTSRG